jgi:uncharacterized membrane protein
MIRRSKLCLFLLIGLAVTAAQASEIPMDDAGFTVYVQKRLQLYEAKPVNVIGAFNLSVGASTDTRAQLSLKPLHDACMIEPAKCEATTDEYIQNAVKALSQPIPAGASAVSGVTTLVVCNQTSRSLAVATIYVPVSSDQWRSVGWTQVDAASCKNVLTTSGRTFYARAEEANREQIHDPQLIGGMVEGDRGIASAGSDLNLCVAHSGSWDAMAPDLDGTCGGKASESVGFKRFQSNGRPVMTWNLAF